MLSISHVALASALASLQFIRRHLGPLIADARTAAGSVHWVFNCRYRSARLRSSRALFIGHLAAETVTRLWGCRVARGVITDWGSPGSYVRTSERTSSSDWQVPKDNCIHDAHEEDRPISERSSGRDLVSKRTEAQAPMVRILLISWHDTAGQAVTEHQVSA